jgi:hypothetical protein
MADDGSVRVSLRNEHLPTFAQTGWLDLRVQLTSQEGSRSARTADETATRGAKDLGRGPVPAGPSRYVGSFDEASAIGRRDGAGKLMGSFASGPQMIWREVPATAERPAYYYSETFGVSQWHRPKMPQPRKLHLAPNDLKAVSPAFDRLDVAEQRALTVGRLPPHPPVPEYFEEEEEGADVPEWDEEEEEEEEEEEALSTPRLPLLSLAARQQIPGEDKALSCTPRLRTAPTDEERQVRHEAAAAKAAAAAAKAARVETARRARLEYEHILSEAEATAAAHEQEKSASEASKPSEAGKAPAAGGVGGGAMELSSAAARVAALFAEPKFEKGDKASAPPPTAPAPAAPGAPRPPGGGVLSSVQKRPKRATMSQLEGQIDEKLSGLRNDGEELERLRKQIRDERRAIRLAKTSAPSYKPYVHLNASGVWSEQTPNKQQARRAQRAEAHRQMLDEATMRHAELVRLETLHTIDAARSRTGEHWPTGHWAVPLPPSRAHTASQAASDFAERVRDRASTLLLAPGAMFAPDTSKGRARRLAAHIARLPLR